MHSFFTLSFILHEIESFSNFGDEDEHISWWRNEALRNWGNSGLFNEKQNVFALFAFHLVIEKLLKAIWVKHNIDNTPPRQHDLTFIYNQTDLNWIQNGMIICQLLIHGILKAVYKQRDHSKDSPFIHSATNKSDSSEGNKKPPKYKSSKEMFDIVTA